MQGIQTNAQSGISALDDEHDASAPALKGGSAAMQGMVDVAHTTSYQLFGRTLDRCNTVN